MHSVFRTLTGFAAVVFAVCPLAMGQCAVPPDFTNGDAIPEKARHDWNLGATGLRGWMFTRDFATRAERQVKVTAVADGSPAHGISTSRGFSRSKDRPELRVSVDLAK